ncbi:hypothetical protein R3P38DRAFT_3169541 [Favolaschia claudopus]|uniref:Uncharacterized protein n=1 Tax=Favolaschia claudopus TaxID=2862362 RepID=A0AAW0E2I3_9AGAR
MATSHTFSGLSSARCYLILEYYRSFEIDIRIYNDLGLGERRWLTGMPWQPNLLAGWNAFCSFLREFRKDNSGKVLDEDVTITYALFPSCPSRLAIVTRPLVAEWCVSDAFATHTQYLYHITRPCRTPILVPVDPRSSHIHHHRSPLSLRW